MARSANARRRGGRGFVFSRPLVALLVLAFLVATGVLRWKRRNCGYRDGHRSTPPGLRRLPQRHPLRPQ